MSSQSFVLGSAFSINLIHLSYKCSAVDVNSQNAITTNDQSRDKTDESSDMCVFPRTPRGPPALRSTGRSSPVSVLGKVV